MSIDEPPLSVLITVPWAERWGGAEEMLCTFLDYADRQRVEPHVVLLADGPLREYLEQRGLRATVIETGRLRQPHLGLRAIRRLAGLIRTERPDAILNWTTKSHVYAALAAILAGRRGQLIWWQHGIPQRDPLDLVAAALPAAVIGCSSRAVAEAQRRVAPWRRTLVIHPGIPAAAESDGSPADLRHTLGVAEDAALIGLVGRLHPMKGQDVFLRALRLLSDEGHSVHGLLVGGDAYGLAPAYVTGLQRLIGELGLSGLVTMTGHVPSAAPYLSAVEILVSASSAEPFGIAILEAMQAGVPVVATPVGGPLEIIENGVTGVLVPERSPRALADAVGRLLNDKDTARSIAEAGRRLVERGFTAEVMTARIVQALSEVAGRRASDSAP